MKKGDLVISLWVTPSQPNRRDVVGIVTRVRNEHRQTVVDVLWPDGLEKSIWDRHLEVVHEEG